jgi:hypothetical protein
MVAAKIATTFLEFANTHSLKSYVHFYMKVGGRASRLPAHAQPSTRRGPAGRRTSTTRRSWRCPRTQKTTRWRRVHCARTVWRVWQSCQRAQATRRVLTNLVRTYVCTPSELKALDVAEGSDDEEDASDRRLSASTSELRESKDSEVTTLQLSAKYPTRALLPAWPANARACWRDRVKETLLFLATAAKLYPSQLKEAFLPAVQELEVTCQPVRRRSLRSAAVLGLSVPVRPQLVDAFAEKHPEVAEKARNKAFRRAQDQINVGGRAA